MGLEGDQEREKRKRKKGVKRGKKVTDRQESQVERLETAAAQLSGIHPLAIGAALTVRSQPRASVHAFRGQHVRQKFVNILRVERQCPLKV